MSFRTIGAAHKDLKPQLQSNLPPANLIRIWTALLKFFSSFTSTILLLRVEAEGRETLPLCKQKFFSQESWLIGPRRFIFLQTVWYPRWTRRAYHGPSIHVSVVKGMSTISPSGRQFWFTPNSLLCSKQKSLPLSWPVHAYKERRPPHSKLAFFNLMYHPNKGDMG